MKNSTQFVGMTLKLRLRQMLTGDPVLLRRFAAAVWGLVYARAGILGITGTFGSALVAGVGYEDTIPACLGAVCGYMLTADPASNVGFALLCIICAAAKLVAGRRWWEARPWVAWFAAGGSVAVVGLPSLFLTGADVTEYLVLVAQGVLAVATAYFVSRLYVAGELVLTRRGRITDASLVICLCILAAGLVSLQIGHVSAGRAAAVLLTVASGYALGGSTGAAVGAASGLAVAFVSGEFSITVALYALGGLLAGTFRPFGRMGSAVAFILCSGFVLLGAGRQMPLSTFVEVTIGTLIFIALPEQLLSRAARVFAPDEMDDGAARRAVSHRLQEAVEALQEIGGATRAVAKKLEEKAGPTWESLPDAVSSQVCRRCPKNNLCWTQNYSETRAVVRSLVEQARREDIPRVELLPSWFLQRCGQTRQLAEAAAEAYHRYVVQQTTRMQVGRVRSIVTDQFDGMAMFLSGIDQDLYSCSPAGSLETARVREAFSRWGVEPLSLICLQTRGRRLEVEARLPASEEDRGDLKILSRLVSETTGRSFALPEVTSNGDEVTLVLRERNRFKVVVEAGQSPQKEGSVCGDTWRSFTTCDGRQHIVLSDGMGCGSTAALDSAMAVSLVARLVQAGADYDSALRMVNSALLVKSGEESLATMDASVIDLYTGKVNFYKAGAAPTIVRRGKHGGSVESASAPAGILNGVSFAHSYVTLKEGDWLVMMSDGATASGVEWITTEVEQYQGEDPGELSRRLARAARLRRNDGRQDDITVICALLQAESF